jgi:hypothetical protein
MNLLMILMEWFRRRKTESDRDWAHVPAPNWACSRRRLGGVYW